MKLRSNRSLLKTSASLLVATAFCTAPVAGYSATATGSIAVSATVLSACLLTTTPLAFGNYNPSSQSSATATVTILCSNGVNYTVGMNGGSNGGTTTTRLMGGPGTDTLSYKVWQDSSHSVNWNDSSSTRSGTGNGVSQVLTAYGTVASSQNIAPGTYSDTLTVTVTY